MQVIGQQFVGHPCAWNPGVGALTMQQVAEGAFSICTSLMVTTSFMRYPYLRTTNAYLIEYGILNRRLPLSKATEVDRCLRGLSLAPQFVCGVNDADPLRALPLT